MHSISTEKAPAAIGPYSQGVVVNGLLFASGQIALSPETGELVGSTIEQQADQVMKFNAVYAKSFGEKLPARSAVGIDKLPKGALIEVEVIASVED